MKKVKTIVFTVVMFLVFYGVIYSSLSLSALKIFPCDISAMGMVVTPTGPNLGEVGPRFSDMCDINPQIGSERTFYPVGVAIKIIILYVIPALLAVWIGWMINRKKNK